MYVFVQVEFRAVLFSQTIGGQYTFLLTRTLVLLVSFILHLKLIASTTLKSKRLGDNYSSILGGIR